MTDRCRNCGRVLRSDESRQRGFGSSCAIAFASLWVKAHPTYVAPQARRFFSRDEVRQMAYRVLNPQTQKEVKR